MKGESVPGSRIQPNIAKSISRKRNSLNSSGNINDKKADNNVKIVFYLRLAKLTHTLPLSQSLKYKYKCVQ